MTLFLVNIYLVLHKICRKTNFFYKRVRIRGSEKLVELPQLQLEMSTCFALRENQNIVERLHTTFQMVNVGMLDTFVETNVSLQLLIIF